jgi:hypothetical protein
VNAPDPDAPVPQPARPDVDERAAKRAAFEGRTDDRYDALLRHLQAGHELPVVPRRRGLDLDIHPTFGKLLIVVGVVVVTWLAAIAVTDWIRKGEVHTWIGPTDTVQSGLRLDGCPDIPFREDVYFPSWVRFEGKVFRWDDSARPIGPNSVGTSYLDTEYRHGDLRLYRVMNDQEGQKGNLIMLRQGEAPAGAIYAVTDCG